ncbi:hypothetical protein RSAG8_09848, partial [Rhizoctonia solani AG-8 WAC10335]
MSRNARNRDKMRHSKYAWETLSHDFGRHIVIKCGLERGNREYFEVRHARRAVPGPRDSSGSEVYD